MDVPEESANATDPGREDPRKEAEEALRKSEKKYRALFNSIDEGFALCELIYKNGKACDLKFLEVNPAFGRLTGLKIVAGKSLGENNLFLDNYWIQTLATITDTRHNLRFEYEAKRLGAWFDIYASPIVDPGERKVAIVFSNITERKRAESELREREARQAFLLRLGDTLRVLDDGAAIQAQACKMTGEYCKADRVFYAEVHEEERIAVIRPDYSAPGLDGIAGEYPLNDFVQNPQSLRQAEPFRVGNTETSPLLSDHTRAVYTGLGIKAFVSIPLLKEKRIVWTLNMTSREPREWTEAEVSLLREVAGRTWSIAERARAEAALRESETKVRLSEERLRLIVENARDYAIFSLDLARNVTTWNPGAEATFGYSAEEVLSKTGDIIFTAEDRAGGAPEAEAEITLRLGRAMDERWHLRKDGSRFWGSGVMMAMHSPSGDKIGLLKILRDETEAKRIQDELHESRFRLEKSFRETEQARREAERANRAKDEFLAALSHELRTPLTPVQIAAETLLRTKDLQPRVKQGLEMICRNIEIETQFIDDLLDVTRISNGKLELNPARLDVHETVTLAVEISRPDFLSKEQELVVKLAAAASHVTGDLSRLQQVFWNLLKNASKFTPDKGRIEVTSRNDAPDSVVIEIADTGRGIEGGALEEIFESFRQESGAITRTYGGLGLGLAIARAIVEAHGGTIKASSPGVGRGSTFSVRLPVVV